MSRLQRAVTGSTYALIVAAIMGPLMLVILCLFMTVFVGISAVVLPFVKSGQLRPPETLEETRRRAEIASLELKIEQLTVEQLGLEARMIEVRLQSPTDEGPHADELRQLEGQLLELNAEIEATRVELQALRDGSDSE